MRPRRHSSIARHALLLKGLIYGTLAALIFAAAAYGEPNGHSVTLRDIAYIEGRPAQLSGYGLVVGLKGTGDGSVLAHTDRSLLATLGHLGIDTHDQVIATGTVAAVLVQAHLSPGVEVGEPVPARIVALGDASDLSGGTLLSVTLRSRDGRFSEEASGSLSSFAVKTIALAPASAIVEQGFIVSTPVFMTQVPDRNFVVGARGLGSAQLHPVADLINKRFGKIATVHSGCDIEINLPNSYDDFDQRANLILELADMPVHEAIPALLVDRIMGSVDPE